MKDSGDEEDLSNKIKLLNHKLAILMKQITEKELQLEKSELMIQLLNSATDSVFLHDLDGNFVYVNEAAYKTRGYTKKELMGMNLHDLDVPQYEKLIEPRIKDLMEEGESIFETAHFRKDGSQIPVEIHSKIIEYENKPLVLSYVRDITERKRVENELISAKEQYRALLDNIGVGIAFISPNMEILELNDQMKEWFPNVDVSKKPICYEAFNFPPRVDICTYCPTYKTLKDGKIHESTTDTPMGDEIINYRVVSSPIKDEEGKVVAAIEMVEDITERKKAEEKLRQSEEKFRAVSESAIDAIITTDSKGIISFFNHSLLELFGYSASELSGKPVSVLIPYGHKNGHIKGMKSFKSGKLHRTGKTSKAVGLKKDGTEFPCEMSLSIWKSGKETYFTSIIRDLTERQKTEDALIRAKEEWEHTFDAVPDLIAILDTNYRIVRINKTMADRLGVDPEEAVGLYCYNAVHGLNDPPLFCPLRKLLEDGQEHTVEVHEDRIGGDFIVSISPIHDSHEKLMGIVHVAWDITERKRAEEALKESEEKFRRIFHNANDMISLNVMNDDGLPGKFLEVNEVANERLGYTRDELLNMSPPDIVAPENLVEMPKNARVLIEKGHNTFEIVHITKDGKRIPVEVNNHLISYKGHEVCLAISRDITDRKKAEEALKKSEEKYRTIFENVQDIFFQTDIKGKIIELSPSVEKYFKINPEELIGNHVDMLYSNPEDRKKLLKVLQEEGEVSDYEITLKDSKNQPIYISANVHFIYDIKNRPTGIEGALRDITERKKAEDALKWSQIHLENAMDLAHLVNWEMNTENMVFTFNDRFYSMYGTTADHEGGYLMSAEDYVKNFVHPEDAPPIFDGFKQMQETGQPGFPEEVEHRIIRRDGETRHIAVHIHFIWDDEGKLIGSYGANQDITERKKAEESLKLSRIRLSNAMDLAHLTNWELDPYKQMFIFNDKFYAMLGTTAEDEGGYHMPIEHYIKEYVHPEDAQFIAEGMKKSLKVREPTFGTEFEHKIIRRDGEIRYLAIHIRVVPSTDTQSLHIYGTVQDITGRKIAEEKLKESLEEKEMLLKEIHHRVKNNLMVISSLLNLQSQYIRDKEALDIFKESQNRAKSMALIHERLYRSTDLKKIDFGDYIHTLATDLFHTYITDPSRVKLNMNVENVMVDINTTVPLGLIVNELVTNTMKHAFPEGKNGEIDIEFHKHEDEFTLIVSDTGVGFPEDIDYKNTDSLGLQLVNNLVSQIDGEISLDRSHGTEFIIKFKESRY